MDPKIKFVQGEYEGQLSVTGYPEGLGKMVYQSGSVYNGQWKDGKTHGTGCLTLPSGEIYSGKFVSGSRSGMGRMKYTNGDVYFGNWKENKRNGTGKIIYKSGDYFKGHFKKGKKHGHGMNKENEMIFVGFWNKNIKLGAFLCFSLDTGKALEVLFEGGEIKKANLINPKMKRRRSSKGKRMGKGNASGRSRDASRQRERKQIDELKNNLIKGLKEIKTMIKSSKFKIMKDSTEQLPNRKSGRRVRPKRNKSIYFIMFVLNKLTGFKRFITMFAHVFIKFSGFSDGLF